MTTGTTFMEIPAIDVHGHCGAWGGYPELTAELLNASIDVVSQRALSCRIQLTLVSELSAFDPAPNRPADVNQANRSAAEGSEQYDNIQFYAVINPKNDGWQAKTDKLLEHPKCVGVKLHPRWNYWSIEEYGDELFGFLNERRLLTLTHTGNAGNEPERFIPFANKYHEVKLILAHIGHDDVDDQRDRQVRAVQMSTQGNVWTDTSSAKSVISRLIEYACDQIGADRILFGTDTPLYYAAMQKARIAYADISDENKRSILYGNASQLLGR